jgi:ribonuclease P protein component
MHADGPGASASPCKRFQKEHRIRQSKDFAAVFDQGRTVVTPVLIFRVLPTPLETSRLGLAVSRKVGKAVKRNIIRRRIREGFRLKKSLFPRSFDIVVSPRKGALDFEFEGFLSSYDILLNKMNRWHAKRKEP